MRGSNILILISAFMEC